MSEEELRNLTVGEISNYIATMDKLVKEGIIKFNKEKAYAEICIDEANAYLEKQSVQLQNNWNELKNILQNIEEIIKGSLRNVGFNEDYYEYMLSEGDIEKILDMIPDFEELEGNNE